MKTAVGEMLPLVTPFSIALPVTVGRLYTIRNNLEGAASTLKRKHDEVKARC